MELNFGKFKFKIKFFFKNYLFLKILIVNNLLKYNKYIINMNFIFLFYKPYKYAKAEIFPQIFEGKFAKNKILY